MSASQVCFKRRDTAVLRWLDWGTTCFQTSTLIQSNKMAVAENVKKGLANF